MSPVDVAAAKRAPVATITEAIQGRTTGVQISNSGTPGQAPVINIRGIGNVDLGPWSEMPAPVPVPDARDNPCPNYSSQLLPSADGLTVLEVALRMTENGCRAFYSTAPLSTPTIRKAPASKKKRKSR